jgi:hypothetical protein
MELVSRTVSGIDIKSALILLMGEMNPILEKKEGKIVDASFGISAGPLGGMVEVTLALDGKGSHAKEILGVNARGTSSEESLERATEEMNQLLEGKGGEVVEVFAQTVATPIPKRVFTTLLLALNRESPGEIRSPRQTIEAFVDHLVGAIPRPDAKEAVSLEIPEGVEIRILPGRMIEVRSRDRSFRKEVILPEGYQGAEVQEGFLLLRPGWG